MYKMKPRKVRSAFVFHGFVNKDVFKSLNSDLLPDFQDWGTKVRIWDPPMVETVIKTPLTLGLDSTGIHPKTSKKEPEGGPENFKDLKLN